jgi:enamine deaminase RidA (YjgF/YER057c/UK114 family)
LTVEQRLAAQGLTLPRPYEPNGTYLPFRRAGNLLFVAGHGPRDASGQYICGQLVDDADVPRGYEAARQVALNMLTSIKLALGSLDRVEAVLKVLGLVNAAPQFKRHPAVIDGFSDVFVAAFGDAGQHARSAVGMSSLPHGMMVEVEAVLLVRD